MKMRLLSLFLLIASTKIYSEYRSHITPYTPDAECEWMDLGTNNNDEILNPMIVSVAKKKYKNLKLCLGRGKCTLETNGKTFQETGVAICELGEDKSCGTYSECYQAQDSVRLQTLTRAGVKFEKD